MRKGDVVIKLKGMDEGLIGVVLSTSNDHPSKLHHKILTVLLNGKVKNWAAHLCEVINENEQRGI